MSLDLASHFDVKAQLQGEISECEAHLSGLIAKLDIMRAYEELMGIDVSAVTPFHEMTKGDAAESLLKVAGGALPAKDLYDAMKERGHPVQDLESLRTLLNKDKRFFKVAAGIYDLASRVQVADESDQ